MTAHRTAAGVWQGTALNRHTRGAAIVRGSQPILPLSSTRSRPEIGSSPPAAHCHSLCPRFKTLTDSMSIDSYVSIHSRYASPCRSADNPRARNKYLRASVPIRHRPSNCQLRYVTGSRLCCISHNPPAAGTRKTGTILCCKHHKSLILWCRQSVISLCASGRTR